MIAFVTKISNQYLNRFLSLSNIMSSIKQGEKTRLKTMFFEISIIINHIITSKLANRSLTLSIYNIYIGINEFLNNKQTLNINSFESYLRVFYEKKTVATKEKYF